MRQEYFIFVLSVFQAQSEIKYFDQKRKLQEFMFLGHNLTKHILTSVIISCDALLGSNLEPVLISSIFRFETTNIDSHRLC